MKRFAPILACFLAGFCGSLVTPVTAQVGAVTRSQIEATVRSEVLAQIHPVLTRLRDLAEYRSTSQIVLNKVPAASATKAVLMMGTTGALASGSASGTYLGINTAAGYAGNLLDFQTNGTSTVVLTATPRLGIGVSDPAVALHVLDSSTVLERAGANANSGQLIIRKNRNTHASPAIVLTGDAIAALTAQVYNGSTGYITQGQFSWTAEGTVSAPSVPTKATVTTSAGTGTVVRQTWDSLGNAVIGTAAIAQSATDGFLYIPSCTGVPSGTPTTYTGRVPLVWDSTGNDLYGYSGGAWRQVN